MTGDSIPKAQVPYDDNIEKEKSLEKVPFFNGDSTSYPFWKTKMYSHIIGIDDELWDLVAVGFSFENMDEEGIVSNANRKYFIPDQKKQYKKHHRVKGIMASALTHDEFLKIVDKSSAKTIWDSLKSTYEGNKQVREAKSNLLVQQYELFKMKDREDVETMFARFQTLGSRLHVLKKSYTIVDHVKKILRSLPAKWRPKVTALQESKNLDEVTLESLISSLRSHEMELLADEPTKKMKSLALN
jgi:hypothetical protein